MRWVRALTALVVLAAGLVGVPLALVELGSTPSPSGSARDLLDRLLRPDDGSLLVGLITMVAWLAWLVFALSVLVELVNLVSAGSHRTVRLRLPGLGLPQQLAGVLLAMVAAAILGPVMARATHSATVSPAAPTSASASTVTEGLTVPEGPTAVSSSRADDAPTSVGDPVGPSAAAPHGQRADRVPKGHLHVVERGDDLWSLAERFYGQGREWRRIAAANPDLLTGGPDRLRVGTRLAIPGVAAAEPPEGRRVVVADGDTLASIAAHVYGDPATWPVIFAANRYLIADPDQIDVGLVLSIPERSTTSPPTPTPEPARPQTDRTPDEVARRSAPPTRSTPAAPTQAAPTQAAPTQAAPTQAAPTQAAPDEQQTPTTSTVEELAPVAVGIGGLLAAGLIAGLLVRRRLQLAARPVGRRILHPTATSQTLETTLGHQQQPMTVVSVDLVLRAVALHCHRTGRALPDLLAARVSAAEVELILRTPDASPPVGFTAQGRRWVVAAGDAGYLSALDGIETAPRAYPTLVTVGTDAADRQILVELEQAGLFGFDRLSAEEAEGLVLAMATELAFAPWADELFVTVVGTDGALPAAAARHNLTHADDVDALIGRLERRAEVQRRHLSDGTARQKRVDPELTDPWAPEVVLVAAPLGESQVSRLRALVTRQPRITAAVVMPMEQDALTAGLLRRRSALGGARYAAGQREPVPVELRPLGWELDLQHLGPATRDHVVQLLAVTGNAATTPAPWWQHDTHPPADRRTDRPPTQHPDQQAGTDQDAVTLPPNVTVLTQVPRRAWADEEDAAVARLSAAPTGPPHHPTVLLLGPLGLIGVAGVEPARASRQCLEYCAWLLEHPGSTAPAMASALAVAEGTRRSNVSRLRSWLGEDDAGEPYLPDAYSGRIFLDPAVSSDWQRLQILTAPGINRTSTESLLTALELVRGAPLADAAPGQWHWAEELRTDMASAVRDLGIELTERALADHDLDLARWAASRALAAAPEDEQLLCARIRTEHQAGHTAEVERLALRVAGQARALAIDLDPDTVILLQQVLEGRVRARLG
ncbi:MAG: LysM peptidoglycan-binding domain-containing protein [Propionibacteriaceae bacterium]